MRFVAITGLTLCLCTAAFAQDQPGQGRRNRFRSTTDMSRPTDFPPAGDSPLTQPSDSSGAADPSRGDSSRPDSRRRDSRRQGDFSQTRPSSQPDDDAFPSTSAVAPLPPSKPYGEKYSVLITRSIFSKVPIRPGGGGPPGPPPTPPAVPEQGFVLRGVADRDGQFVAFFEDTAGSKLVRTNTGDALARGKVRSITLDKVEFEQGGKTQSVRIGQNLLGVEVAAPTTAPSSGTSGSTSGGSADDIAERMRRRRQQEGR